MAYAACPKCGKWQEVFRDAYHKAIFMNHKANVGDVKYCSGSGMERKGA